MSKSIISLKKRKRGTRPTRGPGCRKIGGRWFYSAAWLAGDTRMPRSGVADCRGEG